MTLNSPTVTIVLPVFNAGNYLDLAVRSILVQSLTNWELLIIDDGSTDGAVMRLPYLSDSRIKLLCDGDNRGLSNRLNQAISMALGKYIARMDQDDVCHPERLARQVEFLESHPEVDLLATKSVTMDENGNLRGALPFAIEHKAICKKPWKGFCMPHPTWMGRAEWFKRNHYLEPEPYCCEDQELLLRAHESSRYQTLPQFLLAYRVRSYTPWRKLWRTRIAILGVGLRYFLKRGQWGSAASSMAIAFARIVHDAFGWACHKLSIQVKVCQSETLQLEEREEWKLLIKALKSQSHNSIKVPLPIIEIIFDASDDIHT